MTRTTGYLPTSVPGARVLTIVARSGPGRAAARGPNEPVVTGGAAGFQPCTTMDGRGGGVEDSTGEVERTHRNFEWHSLHVAFIALSAPLAPGASLDAAAVPSALAFSLSFTASASKSGPFEKSLI